MQIQERWSVPFRLTGIPWAAVVLTRNVLMQMPPILVDGESASVNGFTTPSLRVVKKSTFMSMVNISTMV